MDHKARKTDDLTVNKGRQELNTQKGNVGSGNIWGTQLTQINMTPKGKQN